MTDRPDDTLPKQKELEKEIGDYLSRKYGDRVKIISTEFSPLPATEQTVTGASGKKEEKKKFTFDIKPEELVAYLDEYVVRQDEAKAVLATKICTHFNRVRYGEEHPSLAEGGVGRIKNNVLLIGSTGIGKTYLIKLIAQRLGVPFVKGDATKFSETGYVGGDVEDLVRELVTQAEGDLDRAQYGIIYLDEVDKIAGSQYRYGADVSRSGVQRALLKPMEETEVDLKVPHDPISQIEAIEHYRATGKRAKRAINTRNILFVMSGSFAGLEDIVRKRVRQRSMGFESEISSGGNGSFFLKQVKAEDLIQFGFESEFVGRLPVIAVLDDLSVDDLYQILASVNSSVVVGKKQDFLAYGIRILFEDESLREIARRAAKEGTGARGLVSVMEKVVLPFERKLPSADIKFLVITEEIVRQPEAGLAALLHEPDARDANAARYQAQMEKDLQRLVEFIRQSRAVYMVERGVTVTPVMLRLMAEHLLEGHVELAALVDHYIILVKKIEDLGEAISQKCGLEVVFSETAIDHMLSQTPCTEETLNQKCIELFNIFEYGLRLIQQKKGMERVEITVEGVEEPEKFINGLVASFFKET